MPMTNKILCTAAALSIGVHVGLVGLYFLSKPIPVTSKHGVVSVSFVQSVRHGSNKQNEAAKQNLAKPKSEASSPSKLEQPAELLPSSDLGMISEPRAVEPGGQVHESDIFIAEVTKLLEQNRIYPQRAIDREEEGKVIVGLTLDREGAVTSANIEEPSPFQRLNEAALATVGSVRRFPRVPEAVAAPIHLHIPLVYRIERN